MNAIWGSPICSETRHPGSTDPRTADQDRRCRPAPAQHPQRHPGSLQDRAGKMTLELTISPSPPCWTTSRLMNDQARARGSTIVTDIGDTPPGCTATSPACARPCSTLCDQRHQRVHRAGNRHPARQAGPPSPPATCCASRWKIPASASPAARELFQAFEQADVSAHSQIWRLALQSGIAA